MKGKFEKQTIQNNIKWLSFYSIALIPTSRIHHLICDDIKCKKQTNKQKQRDLDSLLSGGGKFQY